MRNLFYVGMLFIALFFVSCADAGKNQEVTSGDVVSLDGSTSESDVFGEIKK